MGQERRHFTDEFKTEAVALLASSGPPLIQIASELGISPSMLRNWRNRSIGGHAGSAPHPIAGPPRDWGCGSKRVLSGSLIGERRQRGLDREAGKHRGRGRRTQHGGHADRPT